MDSTNLPQQLNQALDQVCALPNDQHAGVIFAAHFCVAFIFGLINYFGFTINPRVKGATMFQWFLNILKSILTSNNKEKQQ